MSETWIVAKTDDTFSVCKTEFPSAEAARRWGAKELGLTAGSFFIGRDEEPDYGIDGNAIADNAVVYVKSLLDGEEVSEWAEKMGQIRIEAFSDLDARLLEAFKAWMKKHDLEPEFYAVEDIEEVVVGDGNGGAVS